MKSAEFMKLVENGEAYGVYIIEGAEEYLKEEMLAKLREKLLVPGFEMLNETVFENCGLEEMIEASETLPFMCDKRLVISKDPTVFSKVTKQSPANDMLDNWLKRMTPTCVTLLYIRGEIITSGKLFAVAEKMNRLVHFDLLTDSELTKWAAAELKTLGHSAKSDVLNELVYMTGRRMQRLKIEINKLSATAGKRKEIAIDDVRALVTADAEVKVFEMVNALIDKNGAKAHRLLNQLLDSGETCVFLLSIIISKLRLYAHVAVLMPLNMGIDEIAAKLGEKSQYPVKLAYNKVKALDAKKKSKLLTCYKKSVESDFRIKSGQAEARSVLEEMMYLVYSIL